MSISSTLSASVASPDQVSVQAPTKFPLAKRKRDGCECGAVKEALFGNPGDIVTRWCSICPNKDPNAVNLCRARCKCGKAIPCFGIPPSRKALWCIKCPQKPHNAINITAAKCICGHTKPYMRSSNDSKPLYCNKCPTRPNDVVNVYAIKCECGIQAVFGMPSDDKAKWCKTHSPIGAVDLLSKKCRCGKSRASYGLSGGKREWCTKCKDPSAIYLSGTYCECGITLANFGHEDELKALWCVSCKPKDAVNVTTPRCPCGKMKHYGDWRTMITEWCYDCRPSDGSTIYIGATYCKTPLCFTRANNTSYRGYCLRCFIFTFPSEPMPRNHRIKEGLAVEKIREVMKDYNHLTVMYDKTLGGCSRRRPDIFIDCLTHVIVMEHDENGHRSVECEERRVMVSKSLILYVKLILDSRKSSKMQVVDLWSF